MKKCSKCKIEKEDDEFSRRSDLPHLLKSRCKKCCSDDRKIYFDKNRDNVLSTYREAYQKNKQTIAIKRKKYYQEHKDVIKQHKSDYYISNKNKHSQKHKSYIKHRREKDPLFKLITNIKSLIYHCINNKKFSKKSRTYELLKCSYEDLMNYLGPKPEGNVHLDHICPCAQAQNEEELIKLQHYTNFRWLSGSENERKNDHWTPEGEQKCKDLLKREWIY